MPGFFVPFIELLTLFTLHAKDKFTISRNEIYFKEGIMKKISLLIMMSMVSALMAPPKKPLSPDEARLARRMSSNPNRAPGLDTMRNVQTVVAVQKAAAGGAGAGAAQAAEGKRRGHHRDRSVSESDLGIPVEGRDAFRQAKLRALLELLTRKKVGAKELLEFQQAQTSWEKHESEVKQQLGFELQRAREELKRVTAERDALAQAAAAPAAARQSESDARFERMEQNLQQMAALLRAQSAGASAAASSPYGELPPPPPFDDADPAILPPPPVGSDS